MIDISTPLTFAVNFPADLLAKANGFRRQQQSSQKAQQVYLNTLAVYAVQFYCDCMGDATQLSDSDSWHPAMQTLLDTAALVVPGGSLECRPVLQGMDTCPVPPEAIDERLGYVMVEIDIENGGATLLGFSKTASQGTLHRSDLQSLEDLIDILIPAEPLPEKLQSVVRSLEQVPTQLSSWLNNLFEEPWQPAELVLAASYRSIASITDSPEMTNQQERAKLLTVGSHSLILVVQITQVTQTELDILLKVHSGVERVLPQGLLLELLDDDANVAMATTAEAADNFRALDFQIEPQEAFGVRITVGNDSITESFVS